MNWGNFLKVLGTGVGTALGGPVGGAIVGGLAGGIAGHIGANRSARGMERAGQQAQQQAMHGFNYLSNNPMLQQQMQGGQDALAQQRALLGLGGDAGAAQQAFQQWQDSTGFQHRLNTGSQAITGNAAARGLLGSGSTLRGLTQYGQNLGTQSFDNYFGQLGGLAGAGAGAAGMIGQAATAGGLGAAQMGMQANMGAVGARQQGWDQLMGGIGSALGAWQGRDQGSAGLSPQQLAVMRQGRVPTGNVVAPRPINFLGAIR